MKVSGIECPRCGAQIWSRHRHDYRGCPCGYCHVDGGRDYLRFDWGIPYPHYGTLEEQAFAIAETERVGMPKEVEIDPAAGEMK